MHSMKRGGRVSRLHRRCWYLSAVHWIRPLTSLLSAQSNLTNKSRLQILHRREEQLQNLFEISRGEIAKFAEDEGRYSQFLQGAILQGYLQLLEPKVTLFTREQDIELVRNVGAAAAETYAEMSGRAVTFDVQATLNTDGYVDLCQRCFQLWTRYFPVLVVSSLPTVASE